MKRSKSKQFCQSGNHNKLCTEMSIPCACNQPILQRKQGECVCIALSIYWLRAAESVPSVHFPSSYLPFKKKKKCAKYETKQHTDASSTAQGSKGDLAWS